MGQTSSSNLRRLAESASAGKFFEAGDKLQKGDGLRWKGHENSNSWDRSKWEISLLDLKRLLEVYRESPDQHGKERLFLMNFSRSWIARAKKSACGEELVHSCIGFGRVLTLVLTAAIHSGFTENELFHLFGGSEEGSDSSDEAEQLLGKAILHNATSATVDIIVSCADPAVIHTALELALVLLSGQLFDIDFFFTVFERHPRKEQLLARLITLASSSLRKKAQTEETDLQPEPLTTKVRSVLERLMSASTTGLHSPTTPTKLQGGSSDAAQSVLMLVSSARWDGPFRSALNELNNSSRKDSSVEADSVRVPFRLLYDALGLWLHDKRGAILSYIILSGNRRFRSFALARTDPETIMMPILKLAVQMSKSGDIRGASLVCSTLLSLMEDAAFTETINSIVVSGKNQGLTENMSKNADTINLSELVLNVALYTLRHMVGKMQSVEVCKLSLSVAANIASSVTDVKTTIAERMMKILEVLIKRLQKMLVDEELQTAAEECAEFIGMMLELFVSLLRSTWSKSLVYTMLHQAHVFHNKVLLFSPARTPSFDHCAVVAAVLTQFLSAMSHELKVAEAQSVEQIVAIIEVHARKIGTPLFARLPWLSFKFQPLDSPQDFFKSYAWKAAAEHVETEWDLSRSSIALS
mmetsp:Transcript_8814/g.26489  ORF Transcript_8814/g.26489 Transcript_8814/m.26489 type:complete len:641 (+) Transcript_8814:99-2021(+)|eukprot:CAMPEP_0198734138 /NCGR_PEP_ID=MMETSP1475-20131203/50655_1 /TAXON_ID= ORGANISM="Unidentified sp., Strain CCMP1999" /NCGR_SAMPLE_ID=MMETSP1475 /ASSEMBLY_ACC=CAM_ASM_001111 /LENGTH=640 /DNA_ID=CAMNT_0044497551 /DNA_START=85 /DNA_END=2007 /DNA_ORIENTATION=+